jgi:hypothetical protein
MISLTLPTETLAYTGSYSKCLSKVNLSNSLKILIILSIQFVSATPSIDELLDVNEQVYKLVNCKIEVRKIFCPPDPNMPSTSKASQNVEWYFYCEQEYSASELPLPSPESIDFFGKRNIKNNFYYDKHTICRHRKNLHKLLTRETFKNFEENISKLKRNYKRYQAQFQPESSNEKIDTTDTEAKAKAEAEEKRKHFENQINDFIQSIKKSKLLLQNVPLEAINAPFFDPNYDVNNNLIKYSFNYLYSCIKSWWGAAEPN